MASYASRATNSTRAISPYISPPSDHDNHHHRHVISITRKKTTTTMKLLSSRAWRVNKASSNENSSSSSLSSYLEMWRNAVDRERKAAEFERISSVNNSNNAEEEVNLEKKTEEFGKILEVSKEERDRVQRMQVIDRAAAAIAAARALLDEQKASGPDRGGGGGAGGRMERGTQGTQSGGSIFVSQSNTSGNGVPGPDFWSWKPPADGGDGDSDDVSELLPVRRSLGSPNHVIMTERSMDFLSIPFESKLSETNHIPPIPPLQSLMEVEKQQVVSESSQQMEEEHDLEVLFSAHAVEAAHALDKDKADELVSSGINPDGSRWWKETGIERRPDGVVCRWMMNRGVSADQDVEWQEKFWEAADEFGYKELGSEKSGRDATGNVWREFWRESLSQNSGIVHLEKTADKWGKNGKGDQWQEKWWEHYDASGKSEKWAHKWCSIDPTAQLEAGHAHVWHERWGEKYDGHGGSIKYTDKWAERCEEGGWTKWGDKWDENFDLNGHGVKQGETWWAGKYGERWNRTWGERHNGSGWVHKYGKSSSGEHWDTHVEQETWYERFPHFGFYHCFDNSVQLREVKKPSDWS